MLPGNGLIEGQVFKPSVDYKFLKIRNLDHTLQSAFTTTKTIDVNWLVQWIKRDTYITNCSNVPLLFFVQHNYILLIFSYITNYKLWENKESNGFVFPLLQKFHFFNCSNSSPLNSHFILHNFIVDLIFVLYFHCDIFIYCIYSFQLSCAIFTK